MVTKRDDTTPKFIKREESKTPKPINLRSSSVPATSKLTGNPQRLCNNCRKIGKQLVFKVILYIRLIGIGRLKKIYSFWRELICQKHFLRIRKTNNPRTGFSLGCCVELVHIDHSCLIVSEKVFHVPYILTKNKFSISILAFPESGIYGLRFLNRSISANVCSRLSIILIVLLKSIISKGYNSILGRMIINLLVSTMEIDGYRGIILNVNLKLSLSSP